MRVLIAHNRYRSAIPSGENAVVDATVHALREAGVDVVTWMPSSDVVGQARGASLAALANPVRPGWSLSTWRRRLLEVRPDLLHLHNPYPLLPPAIVDVAVAAGVPVLQTVHNARHVCAKGTFTRDERPCFDCQGRRPPWPAVVHACYRDSRPQSVVMAAAITLHHDRFRDDVMLLPVSRWLADRLAESGFRRDRMVAVPNGTPDPGPCPPPGHDVIFAGRLDEEKGVDRLVEAWSPVGRASGRRLTIVGDGPLRPLVEASAAADPSIRFLGRLGRTELGRVMEDAGVVVVPSRVPESFGLVCIEAFAAGRPVVAVDAGAIPEIVDDSVGWLFTTTDELSAILRGLSRPEIERRGRAARTRFLGRYSVEQTTRELLGVYREVLGQA